MGQWLVEKNLLKETTEQRLGIVRRETAVLHQKRHHFMNYTEHCANTISSCIVKHLAECS